MSRGGRWSSLLDEVEAAREDGVEAAGAPAANGVADERRRALAVTADDRGAAGRCGVLALGSDRHADAATVVAAPPVGDFEYVEARLRNQRAQRGEPGDGRGEAEAAAGALLG